MRDLARAREDAVDARMQARHQLKAFLLRHELRYPQRTSWTKSFYRWLSTLSFESSGAQTAFTEYWQAVCTADERVARLTDTLVRSIAGWRFEPVVKALRVLRGIDWVSAIGLAAEIGDMQRFSHPRQLMAYLGLVPSEHSSGDRVLRGGITKAGNKHARRLLTEAAWNYRFRARVGYAAQRRAEDLPQGLRNIGWKAQLRLTGRFARLHARGLHHNKICVAIARELAGFVWALARQATQLRPS
jgi:transposase